MLEQESFNMEMSSVDVVSLVAPLRYYMSVLLLNGHTRYQQSLTIGGAFVCLLWFEHPHLPCNLHASRLFLLLPPDGTVRHTHTQRAQMIYG